MLNLHLCVRAGPVSSVSSENFACEVFLPVIHVLMVGGIHQTQSIEDSGKGIEASSILAKFVKISTVWLAQSSSGKRAMSDGPKLEVSR